MVSAPKKTITRFSPKSNNWFKEKLKKYHAMIFIRPLFSKKKLKIRFFPKIKQSFKDTLSLYAAVTSTKNLEKFYVLIFCQTPLAQKTSKQDYS